MKNLKKIVLSGMFLALGIVLPFVTGQIPQIGSMLCPMHIPVLLCGFICGWQYGLVVGLIVEKIAEVVEITEDNILDSPSLGNMDKAQNRYVYGIGKVGESVKLLLDPERLLRDEDVALMEHLNEEDSLEEE